jgi:hypothetical protein
VSSEGFATEGILHRAGARASSRTSWRGRAQRHRVAVTPSPALVLWSVRAAAVDLRVPRSISFSGCADQIGAPSRSTSSPRSSTAAWKPGLFAAHALTKKRSSIAARAASRGSRGVLVEISPGSGRGTCPVRRAVHLLRCQARVPSGTVIGAVLGGVIADSRSSAWLIAGPRVKFLSRGAIIRLLSCGALRGRDRPDRSLEATRERTHVGSED